MKWKIVELFVSSYRQFYHLYKITSKKKKKKKLKVCLNNVSPVVIYSLGEVRNPETAHDSIDLTNMPQLSL